MERDLLWLWPFPRPFVFPLPVLPVLPALPLAFAEPAPVAWPFLDRLSWGVCGDHGMEPARAREVAAAEGTLKERVARWPLLAGGGAKADGDLEGFWI